MCGILGHYLKKPLEHAHADFRTGSLAIKPRGVSLHYVEKPQEFYAYSRLPTDDVTNTDLNYIQQIGDAILLYNGIITNTAALRQRFKLPESTLHSDTLCLLHGFNTYNGEFVSYCRGMFAFAFITDDYIFLVRDTIGIKPLYYIHDDTYFAFSSEIKGLINLKRTITEVKPGEILMFDKAKHTLVSRSFSFKSTKHYSKDSLFECLYESIVVPTVRYLDQAKNKKVGLLLSGGLDSSVILKMLYNHLGNDFNDRIEVFAMGVKDSTDILCAQQLTKDLKIPMHRVMPYQEEEVMKRLPDVVYKVESKLTRVVKVGMLQAAIAEQVAEKGINVILSGEGADELFFGYERFINGLTAGQIDEMYQYFFKRVFYYTLLQRYERIFAHKLIEGRVPYLDQELIKLASAYSVEEKIGKIDTNNLSKIPLRNIAKEIGLPSYVYTRKKDKMTFGATKKSNTDELCGYLEEYTKERLNISFKEIVKKYYQDMYSHNGADVLNYSNRYGTEEEAMQIVSFFKKLNGKDNLPVFHIEP